MVSGPSVPCATWLTVRTKGSQNAGGRPSAGSYSSNPKIEVILPKAGSITYVPVHSPVSLGLTPRSRLHLPEPLGHPINLTVFRRNKDGALGEQVATTGPYSDTLSGVCIAKTKLEAGIYLFIPSTYDKGMEGTWTLNVWSDVGLSAENAK
jgi:calpain-7